MTIRCSFNLKYSDIAFRSVNKDRIVGKFVEKKRYP